MRGLPEKVSDAVRAANPHIFGEPQMTQAQAKAAVEYARESQLQEACEQWLDARGYRRLTPVNCVRDGDPCGWYGHLTHPKGNPFMADVFVFDCIMARSLLVELKIVDDYQPGQLPMIRRGCWMLAHSLDMFSALVRQWEDDCAEVGTWRCDARRAGTNAKPSRGVEATPVPVQARRVGQYV